MICNYMIEIYTNAILKNGDLDLFQVSFIKIAEIFMPSDVMKFLLNYVGIQNTGLTGLG